jgi:hypothetical protein
MLVIYMTRVGAVVDNKGKIKKLPDGKWIIVYDTLKNYLKDMIIQVTMRNRIEDYRPH